MSVYKITHSKYPNDCYIGSTKNPVNERLWGHKTHSLYPDKFVSKLYDVMRIENREGFIINTICSVDDLCNLRKKEQEFITNINPSWNTIKSYRTKDERREYEKIRQQSDSEKERKRAWYLKKKNLSK